MEKNLLSACKGMSIHCDLIVQIALNAVKNPPVSFKQEYVRSLTWQGGKFEKKSIELSNRDSPPTKLYPLSDSNILIRNNLNRFYELSRL